MAPRKAIRRISRRLPTYAEGWQIKPDVVFTLAEDYPVPATGTVEYKYFEVPTNFTEDKFVQAFEVRPGDRSVVHHIIVYARAPPAPPRRQQRRRRHRRRQRRGATPPFRFAPGDAGAEERGSAGRRSAPPPTTGRHPRRGSGAFVGAFAPGQGVRIYEEGTAIRVPAGATLTFQMHYTANGKASTDRSKIAMVFAKAPPKTGGRDRGAA